MTAENLPKKNVNCIEENIARGISIYNATVSNSWKQILSSVKENNIKQVNLWIYMQIHREFDKILVLYGNKKYLSPKIVCNINILPYTVSFTYKLNSIISVKS